MSGKRIVEETACDCTYGRCSSPHRRTLTEGQYVLIEKVNGSWPEWAYTAMRRGGSHRGMLDALSDHTEGTP